MNRIEFSVLLSIVAAAVFAVFMTSLKKQNRNDTGWRIKCVLFFSFLCCLSYDVALLVQIKIVSKIALSLCTASSTWMLLFCAGFTGKFLGGSYDKCCSAVRPLAYAYVVFDTIALLTNPIHDKWFDYMFIYQTDAKYLIGYTVNHVYATHALFMIIFTCLTLGTLILEAVRSPVFFGSQLLLVETTAIIAVVANFFYIIAAPTTYDIAVPLQGITGIVFYSYVYVFAGPSQTLHIRRIMIDNMGASVVYFDKDGYLSDYNQSASSLLSLSEDYIDVLDESMFVEGRFNRQLGDVENGRNYDLTIPDSDTDTLRYFEVKRESVTGDNGKPAGAMYIFRDVSDVKALNSEIERIAMHDDLTGFENKLSLESIITEFDTPDNYPLTVCVVNINGLSLVNNIFGFTEGDSMVTYVSDVIKSQLRVTDRVIRLDGETVVFMPLTTDAQAVSIMSRIKHMVEISEDFQVKCYIEFGVSEKSASDISIRELLANARASMYRKKMLTPLSPRNAAIVALNRHFDDIGYHRSEQQERVAARCQEMCKRLNLTDELTGETMLLSALHDIGMLAVSDSIITQAGPLTEEDWEEIKKAPERGYEIASAIPEMSSIATYILAYRERWDGSGYPNGLTGQEIPLPVRIVSVVKVYDLLTTGTFYNDAMSPTEALVEISREAGSQFDPEITEIFVKMIEEEMF